MFVRKIERAIGWINWGYKRGCEMQRMRVLILILVFCILSVEILYYFFNKRELWLCALCFLCSQLWRHLRVWRLPKDFKRNCLHVWRWWLVWETVLSFLPVSKKTRFFVWVRHCPFRPDLYVQMVLWCL